jgi:hypothetical protein
MPTKMLNPNTTLVVILESNVVNPLSPTAAELNGGNAYNISCAVTRGYNVNPTDSDTDDTASICDTGNVSTRLYDNYEGEITFFRDANIADNTSVYNTAFNFFKTVDQRFWVYRRIGKKSTVAFADGDLIEGFLFSNDHLRSVDGGDAGPIQFTVPMLAQGYYTGYTYVGTLAAPTVTAILPTTGPAAGGTTVVLTGTNFNSAYSAVVGSTIVALTVISNTSASIVTPAHAAGTANIRVTNPIGQSATGAGNLFTYS